MARTPISDGGNLRAPVRPRRSGAPVDADLGRFSPLNAPQRETLDAFCTELRPWALRQADRSYRQLPEALREQAVDRAFLELRTRGPQSLDRRALTALLSERLTQSLRQAHVGWCLNESTALLRRDGIGPPEPEVAREDLAGFVEDGLGGLERAVLQLEIGAGRDSRTARAALRLDPRKYAKHREDGLAKLRSAISAQVAGRACDQHIPSIISAATGDRAAMTTLSSGTRRCRSCAREAQGLRSILHERLALAPWPLMIKPAGLVAAKLGPLGAVVAGKAAGGAGAGAGALGGSFSPAAGVAATVMVAATLATGAATVVGTQASLRALSAPDTGVQTAGPPADRVARRAAVAATVRSGGGTSPSNPGNTTPSRTAAPRQRTAATRAPVASTVATPPPPAATTVAAAPTAEPSSPVKQVADGATDTVRETVEHVASQLPPTVAEPVTAAVDNVTDSVTEVTNVTDTVAEVTVLVDRLINP